MKKTILLTGATGFLGSHLLEKFFKEGHKVIILKRSFSNIWRINHLLNNIVYYDIDKNKLEIPFKENKIDIVIHTATNYGRENEKSSEIVKSNLFFPLELLEIAISFNTDTFFNTDTILYKYLNFYSLSKKQFVEWAKLFCNKIKIINLKLEHMYGEKDDFTKFVPFIIKQLLMNVKKIKLTKGEQKRDFIYVSDIVNAYYDIFLQVKNFGEGFHEYEIGSGEAIKIKSLVQLLKKLTNNKNTVLSFGDLPYRKNEIMESKSNIKKIKEEIGWQPQVALKEGLLKVIEWYKNYKDLK